MPQPKYKDQRAARQIALDGGLNDSQSETLLAPSQSPRVRNVEFDRRSLANARGSIKFGNQVAPRSAIRTKVDPALSPLYFTQTLAVPLRGSLYLPYCEDTDVGGRFDHEGSFDLGTQTFHNRRGRSREINVSFQVPAEEKLYEKETRGSAAPAVGAETATFFPALGFDEGLDDCTIILQKGGDRTTPMSWAIGITNVGAGVGLTGLPAQRPSNYALVFMWLDAPQWGESGTTTMRYNLSSGVLPTAGSFCTQAFRAVLIHKYVEPGKRYSLSIGLAIDSGSPGAAATNTAWNHDGSLMIYVSEDGGTPTAYTSTDSSGGLSTSGLEVVRGPQDSLRYLIKYGVRYAGRDAVFGGLGMRSLPWQIPGFIPYGSDCTALAHGGFQMVDRSAALIATLYGGGVHTLTAAHTLGDAYVTVNHAGLSSGNTNGGISPYAAGGPGAYSPWTGLGNGTPANANLEALRGYRFVMTNAFPAGTMRGGLLSIASYHASLLRMNCDSITTLGTWAATPVLVQCFRWNQRELVIGEIRIWSQPRDYADADLALAGRRKLSLHSSIELDDRTEPDLENLIAYWPCDDSEGALVREKVVGDLRHGFLTPFGLGVSDAGWRGKNLLFLSGEGEAPCFDLSENPVFLREFAKVQGGGSQGFALELSCVFTEAFYAIQDNTVVAPDVSTTGVAITGSRPRFVPELLSWDARLPTTSGIKTTVRPLLALTHRGLIANTNAVPFKFPVGFSVEVAHRADTDDIDPIVPSDLQPFYVDGTGANHNRYGYDAPWVGKRVTIQIGIQPASTGTVDEYDVYVAMSPKDAFLPETGDPSSAEFAYWTKGGTTYTSNADIAGYFSAAHLKVRAKDIVRSVITLGRWNAGILGFAEIQPRMLAGELRVFASAAPGALPTLNGGVLSLRNGKLEGSQCLPPRALSEDDILRPLGPGTEAANLNVDSATITPPANGRFFAGTPQSSIDALAGTFLYVPGDTHDILKPTTTGLSQEEFYRVASVTSSGASATLGVAYERATRANAGARSMRLVAYTNFADDLRDRPLSLGLGSSFVPATDSVARVVLTDAFWKNGSPVTGDGKLRIYSPLGRVSLSRILPSWTRGLVTPRRNRILGATAQNDRKYMTARGGVFEVDDRWRRTALAESLDSCLKIRSATLAGGITKGEQDDRVEFATPFTMDLSDTSFATILDARVELDEIGQYQTILWVGDPSSDPSLFATTTGHRLHVSTRLNRGRPELVIGADAYYVGTTRPEKGLFIATSATAIRAGEPVHIRWYLPSAQSGAVLRQPWLKINGKSARVTVNATDIGIGAPAADGLDWLRTATIVPPGATGKTVIGAAHDSYRLPAQDIAFSGTAQGVNLKPQRLHGWMHSLGGLVADVVVTRQIAETGIASGIEPANFDPNALDYAESNVQLQFRALSNPEGVGHRVLDEAGEQRGVIVSHPFISKWHEFGFLENQTSFAEFGEERLYLANGGRVARVQNGIGGLAGVFPPTVAPAFRIERFGLWKPNVRAAGQLIDPIAQAADGAARQINHYDNHGNNYLQQSLSLLGATEMNFINDPVTGVRYFGFKCYFRPRTTAGRQVLWRRGRTNQGGPFVELRDGKIAIGWYDVFLKKEVFVETSSAIVTAGRWHYLYVRKRWPQHDAVEGNWVNQYQTGHALRRITMTGPVGTFQVGEVITGTAGTGRVVKVYGAAATKVDVILTGATPYTELTNALVGGTSGATGTLATNIHPTNDMLILRLLGTAAVTGNDCSPLLDTQGVLVRNSTSFTTDAVPAPAGTTASGMVTVPGITYSGSATAGRVTAVYGQPFHDSMLGMYWQWGSGATNGSGVLKTGKLYRIVDVNLASQFIETVLAESSGAGTAEVFNGITAKLGGVFTGISLKKSPDFDNSKNPDDGLYDITAFGSPDQGSVTSGIAPYDGEFASFGWTMIPSLTDEGVKVFENVDSSKAAANDDYLSDASSIGCDHLNNFLWVVGNAPDELHFDAWAASPVAGTFACFDGRAYGAANAPVSTQPNEDREIAVDTTPVCSVNATPLSWKDLQLSDVAAGPRYARVAFYDIDQDQVSDPGPSVLIDPGLEDIPNASAQIRIVLADLPQPSQTGRFEVLVYLSLAEGTDASMFLAARVPAGTSEVVFQMTDTRLALQEPMSFLRAMPPRCELVAAARSRMFYGALETDPDTGVFSLAGFPTSVDFTYPFRLSSGQGRKLTMLAELDGLVVVAKRRALGSLTIDGNGVPVVDVISTGVGCVAHQSAQSLDHRLYFVSERGLSVVLRTGVNNLGLPIFVGSDVRMFFQDEVDARYLDRASAAINVRRDQYVVALRAADATGQSTRLSAQYDPSITDRLPGQWSPSAHRFSTYEGPSVTALASAESDDGGAAVLIGGTEEGFAVWLDRADSQLEMMGEDPSTWGDVDLTNTAVDSSLSSVLVAPGDLIDATQEGVRGLRLRYLDDAFVERTVTLLGSAGQILFFDRLAEEAIPASNALALGAIVHEYETPWMDMGNPERTKQGYYLDLIAKPESSGTLEVVLYREYDDSVPIGPDPISINLAEAVKQLDIARLEGRFFKVLLRSPWLSSGQRFEIASMVWRLQDEDQD